MGAVTYRIYPKVEEFGEGVTRCAVFGDSPEDCACGVAALRAQVTLTGGVAAFSTLRQLTTKLWMTDGRVAVSARREAA